jgi:hypothetical protein
MRRRRRFVSRDGLPPSAFAAGRSKACAEPPSLRTVSESAGDKDRFLLFDARERFQAIVDPRIAAQSAGLRYVSDMRPGIRRKRAGTGFVYAQAAGEKLRERDALKRIKALAIPPAWTEVWICPFANGHVQATGRDARGESSTVIIRDFAR